MKKIALLFCVVLLNCQAAFCQKVIKGNILMDSVNAAPGVSVRIKGLKSGTATDMKGNFSLFISSDELKLIDTNKIVLISTYSGYTSTETNLNNSKYVSLIIDQTQTKKGFSWPPPGFSAFAVIPPDNFKNCLLIKDVNKVLADALDKQGYTQKGYYGIPGGFAVVTQIEQMDKNGVALKKPERWSVNTYSPLSFSLASYLRALFFSTPGYFRVIVFIVTTDVKFKPGAAPDKDASSGWFENGTPQLDKTAGDKKFTKDHLIEALIYEFKKPESDPPLFVDHSELTGNDHLIKSGIPITLINNK